MSSCAPRLAQSMLELGGKSALVVFPDVAVDDAVVTAMRGMLTNGGQGLSGFFNENVQADEI